MKAKRLSENVPAESFSEDCHLVNFTNWLARAVTHPDTPESVRDALSSIIVNTISNESGYSWVDDAEGLAFLLPRYLFHMNEQYAKGIMHAVGELIDSGLPPNVRAAIGGKFGGAA
jgi:hypothetical protein